VRNLRLEKLRFQHLPPMSGMEGTPDSRRAPEESEAELTARDGEGVAEEKVAAPGGSKRGAGAATQPQALKRPRYNDKNFGDLSVNDLEGIVREANALKRQCAAKDEELANLKELRAEKAALARQVKALEAEVAASQKETEKCKAAIKDQDDEVATQVDRLKKALKQTLSSQMVYASAFKDQLQEQGREISVWAANVTPELVKALGLEAGSKNKYSDSFFGTSITKTSNNCKLVLARMMSVKYFKTSCELRLDASYSLEGAKKPAKKKTKATKGAAKGAADEEAHEEEEDDAEEEEEKAHDEGVDETAGASLVGGADVE